MEGPDGIQLIQMISATERGNLWRAMRYRKDDRIVRIIDPRFCDLHFRQSLTNLRYRHYPRMLQIIGEGWAGVHFYIEYSVDSPWDTLEEYFKKLHWRLRLPVLSQICEAMSQWNNCPVHPLGLNEQSIIMQSDVGHWFPWLLPCPALPYSSPCDLFDVQSSNIATLAPEFIRKVHLQDRALDIYALGAIATHALGCMEIPQFKTEEEFIEAQVCGRLLFCELKSSAIEDFLFSIESLKRLIEVIHRCTHISIEARPLDTSELKAACNLAFNDTTPGFLASHLTMHQNSREALKILEWGFDNFGENLPDRLLAADICEKLEEIPQALTHLDRAVLLNVGDYNLLLRRCQLRWSYYQKLSSLSAGAADPDGDLLLRDSNWFKSFPMSSTRRTTPYLIAASVYRRRQKLTLAAQELYTAANDIDQSDMIVLWLYGECLIDLGEHEKVAQVVHEAHRRLDRMTKTELMEKPEADKWLKKFDSLMQS